MTPVQLAGWLRSSWYGRERGDFERALAILERASTVPDVRGTCTLSLEQLRERRGELLSELAAVEAALISSPSP